MKKDMQHWLVMIAVMVVAPGVRWLTRSWVLNIDILYWELGLVLGFLFVFSDGWWSEYLTRSDGSLIARWRLMRSEKQSVGGWISYLINENYPKQLQMMRGVLFVGCWIALAIFTMTSVGGFFAKGIMVGIGTHIVWDYVADYFVNESLLLQRFWQIKREMAIREVELFVGVMIVVYLMLVLIG